MGVKDNVLARKLARARGGGALAALGGGGDMPFAASFGDEAGDAAFGFGAEEGLGSGEGFVASAAPADPATRAWRLALARAARDQMKMTVGFADLTLREASLTEVLETPMQRALILMLQGRGDGMGLMILSGQFLAAMIEMLTLSRLSPHTPDAADLRKPTRTDAAMAVEFVDATLAGFEGVMAESGAGDWAAGYRYAAFIDDPRPLHLMLEEGDYHLLTCDLALEDGTRRASMALALPKAGQSHAMAEFAPMDFGFDAPAPLPEEDDHFTTDFAAQVQDLPAPLDASLARISLPIDRVMRLQVGEVLPLPLANLDMINVMGLDGHRVAGARLGQNRGMRALRLTDVPMRQTESRPASSSAALAHGGGIGQAALGIAPRSADFGAEVGGGAGASLGQDGPIEDAFAQPFDAANMGDPLAQFA